MSTREYCPYEDPDFGQRMVLHIEHDPDVALYLSKLAKGWPATMAAAAARRFKAANQQELVALAIASDWSGQ